MFLVKEKQKELQENLKTISDDKTYQMLVNKVIKCFKKNMWTMMIALLLGVVVSIVLVYLLYRFIFPSVNDFWILKILFFCISFFLVVLGISFAQWIGFIIGSRRISSDELLYLNGTLLLNAFCKKQDNSSISINNNGVFFSDSSGGIALLCEDIPGSVQVIIKEYYQLTDLCVTTFVREYQVYDKDKLINRIVKKIKGSSWELLMDEL